MLIRSRYAPSSPVLFQVPLANQYQAACVAKLKEEAAKHPEMQDLDDLSTSADGRSTAAVSSAGTPMASGNTGTKLKLTFNNNKDGYANGGGSGMVSDDD